MSNGDLKIRTKDYALSVIRLFAELPKKTETQIMGRQLTEFIARDNSAKPPSITSPKLRRAIVHHLHLLQQEPDKWVANG